MASRTLNLDDRTYRYLLDHSLRETPVQRALRRETAAMPMAVMQIAPDQGQFMQLLVRLLGARRTIEVGVFTGYSTLATALALPDDGRIVACDVNREWTDIARRHWAAAGVKHKIDLRLGPALETLDALLADGGEQAHDFAFIDADKNNYSAYYERCLRLLRPGGLIAIDNTLWSGSVADPSVDDADTRAIRALNEALAGDDRIDLSLVPIGDGLTLAVKR